MISTRRTCILLALLYVLLAVTAFSSDLIFRVPVLDARENLALAERIAKHDLPAEPFYRALLYPWVLAHLPAKASLAPYLGLICHLFNALLCGAIAGLLWKRRAAAYTAGILYAVYPVALFFSFQILDITFALTWFLASLYCLVAAVDSRKYYFSLMAGGAVGLAVLARPNFLPVALFFPVGACVLEYWRARIWGRALVKFAAVALPFGLLMMLQGVVNYRLSGELRVLPWQGSYNLYAANRAGANGKFYQQQVVFDRIPSGMNPTRMESVYLYQQTGNEDVSIDAMGDYWRKALVESVREDPARWIGLMGRKLLYLVNDWEQYNNLSYHYHKERLVLLKWNPLGWGILLLGSVISLLLAWRVADRGMLAGLLFLVAAYAAGVLLFFVSARFRLPLASVLCVFCGGLVCVPWRALQPKQVVLSAACGIAVLFLSFGNWHEARDRSTYIQDDLLLSNAASKLGEDHLALHYAEQGLNRSHERQDLLRVKVASLFNLWMQAFDPAHSDSYWLELEQTLPMLTQDDASSLFIKGVALWRSGRRVDARMLWEQCIERYGQDASMCRDAIAVTSGSLDDRMDPSVSDMWQRVLND
ncbi:ArnT family glycosyltransferase [Coraliomargarita parva]|uniref:ArnT family glycosyltransferase n=1 Tax=Coraliomargarita parva TaxID=3014050 RepID=UPI0022B535EC|nr:hypothetical protein [Coraliomargarita parva]